MNSTFLLTKYINVYIFVNSISVLTKTLIDSDCSEVTIQVSKLFLPFFAVNCVNSYETLMNTFLDIPTYSSNGVTMISFTTSVLSGYMLFRKSFSRKLK